eukprot:COSAG02_NODE_283_length_25709_cov_24.523311_8_plen_89_part_00
MRTLGCDWRKGVLFPFLAEFEKLDRENHVWRPYHAQNGPFGGGCVLLPGLAALAMFNQKTLRRAKLCNKQVPYGTVLVPLTVPVPVLE